jgi:hypothetical protein
VLTVRVTNSSGTQRSWNVEPYGDEVWLSPGDVLEVQYECSIDAVLDVGLHPEAEVMWAEFAGGTAVPEGLMLNGRSLWPTT